ncbi:MAG: SDR family oxidoreductase [Isosphaeraceae bacterium]|nr:SDR family oxidoreductase [Isosphaeraceae bacterium]
MRIVLTGASGQLGAYLVARLIAAGHDLVAWSGTDSGHRGGVPLVPVDLADASATEAALDAADPALILHTAAISTAEAVRRDPERAFAVNIAATRRLADWCRRRGRRLVYTSTDLVFDGTKPWNREEDLARPVLAYGRTKLQAEPAVLAVLGGLVARVSLLYGPSRCGRESYFDRTIAALRRGEPQTLFEDEFRTPLDLATAADLLVRLAESSAAGLIHVAGIERVSRYELIRRAAIALGLDPALVRANRQADAPLPEPRPKDVSLETERLAGLLPEASRPSIEQAIRGLYDSL